MMHDPLILVPALPLAAALLNSLLPTLWRKVVTLAALLAGLLLLLPVYGPPTETLALFGMDLLRLDALGWFVLFFIQAISLVIFLFALRGLSPDLERPFLVRYPLTVGLCAAVVVSDHMMMFLIFWGLSGLALYLFALIGEGKSAPQTAKKTFILVGGSDAFLIMGLAMLWDLQPEAGWSLAATSVPLDGSAAVGAFILLLIAALTKAGGFPFHTWVPDFSQDAPVESAALLPASLDKLLGIYLLTRMMVSLFAVEIVAQMAVITIGALTVITAVMMAMHQHEGRRLLGYHAVSQVGYMIMGVGSGHPLALAGGLFHMINHILYKSNLFLSLGAVEKRAGSGDLNKLGGLARVMPLTFLAALTGALAISGIPPFNGFFSKWMIYQGLLEKTAAATAPLQLWLLACILAALVGSVLTLASFMKFLHAVFLGQPRAALDRVREAPLNQWLTLGILSTACIAFGIFAVELPLRWLIAPVLAESGLAIGPFPGSYSPLFLTAMMLAGLLTGWLGYRLLRRRVRYDGAYLGGMGVEERFRVTGTAFYKEVRDMRGLAGLFRAAEHKRFDMYHLGGASSFAIARMLRRAHPGQLQLYLLYIVLGVLLFILLI